MSLPPVAPSALRPRGAEPGHDKVEWIFGAWRRAGPLARRGLQGMPAARLSRFRGVRSIATCGRSLQRFQQAAWGPLVTKPDVTSSVTARQSLSSRWAPAAMAVAR